ncbi:ester cyclase [Halomicroarcula sp. GCM10025324]|uniref:ester cyclase n=1 Tax=Haloarcula TaxID=2237 RepID=UPI0023E84AB9|nr:ester cyclase [Halomicroarcula sp. ZS-22-S1]
MAISNANVEANRAIIERENDEINTGGSFDYIDELYAEEVIVNITRAGAEKPLASREAIKNLYQEWKIAFPDLRVEVEHEAAEGDIVMQYVTMRGTHKGVFRGVEPTGNEIAVPAFHMRRIKDGKIVETASTSSFGTLLRQIGVELPVES